MRRVLLAVFVGLLSANTLRAQTISLETTASDSATTVVRALLARNSYQVIDHDTLIGREQTTSGDLIVLGARVTLEGRVAGGVAVINGDLFVRPPATIDGPIAVLGSGGAFASGLATTGGIVYVDPRYTVEAIRDGETVLVEVREPPPPPIVRLPGLSGLGLPTYDRVNGLTPSFTVEAGIGGDTARAALRLTGRYHSAREAFSGGASLRFLPTRRTLIQLDAGRATRTSDAWIRGDLSNTLASLLIQSDARDYFESDEVALTLARIPPPPLIRGEWFVAPRLTFRVSRDRSLPASDPWSLLTDDDGWGVNPPIDEGVLASVVLAASAGWQGMTASFTGEAAAEWAPAGIGDFSFGQLSLAGSWEMQALWDHNISVTGYGLIPLGGDEAPLQRWTRVGGRGTLPTLPLASMRGDHLVFIESLYFIPISRLRVPLLGAPAIRLGLLTGAAWRTGDPRPDFAQNLGAGIQLNIFNAMLYVDPAERPRSLELQLGAELSNRVRLPFF